MSTQTSQTDPPQTRAALVRSTLKSAVAALSDAVDLPADDPQARFEKMNVLTLALAGHDSYPGPRDTNIDDRAVRELIGLKSQLKYFAELVADLSANLRANRLELAGRYTDLGFPTLAAHDFARGLFVHSLPTGMSAHVGRWADLDPAHPARQFIGEGDTFHDPVAGRVLALAIDSGQQSPTGGTDLSTVLALTRRVATEWTIHRVGIEARAERRRKAEADAEAERLASDPLAQVHILRAEVERLKAGRTGWVGR